MKDIYEIEDLKEKKMIKIRIGESSLEVIVGDITKQSTDAIVNAANNRLIPGGGVDGFWSIVVFHPILEECLNIFFIIPIIFEVDIWIAIDYLKESIENNSIILPCTLTVIAACEFLYIHHFTRESMARLITIS